MHSHAPHQIGYGKDVMLSPGEEDDDESYVQLRLLLALAVFCLVSAFVFVAPPGCDSAAGVD